MRKALVIGVAFAAMSAIGIAVPVIADAAPSSTTASSTSNSSAHTASAVTKHVTPLQTSKGRMSTSHVCAAPMHAGGPVCLSMLRTDIPRVYANAITPDATPAGYGPPDLQGAYSLPSSSGGSGQTVAVTEAADNPNLESDLGTYRAQYGLPSCTTANGCFRKVNGSGVQGNYPPGDTGWGGEASLDVDMISAVCPGCRILVVESTDLVGAQNVAVSLGARYISNSWGTGSNLGDSAFNHAGVVDVASSGDSGFGVSYPAGEQSVVAVGGTSLNRASGTSRGWSETAWSGAGSGCASGEPKPSWQHDTGCSSRTIADVSAVADPGTGVAFYDTYGQGGWGVVGGTSVASPIIASVYALAANPPSGQPAASTLYANAGALHDVTSGSNGSCSPAYLCNAGSGYDGPTGLGTPNGTAAFGGSGSGTGGGGTGPIVSGVSASLCVDDNGGSTTAGSHVQIWGCNGTGAQNWTVASNGTLQVEGGCMDVTSSGTTPGTLVQYWPCNGTGAQQWRTGANGSLVNPQSGLCLDDPGFSTTQGTQLEIWTCNGGSNQHWTLP